MPSKVCRSVTDLLGNTPLVELSKIREFGEGKIYGKCEFCNPTSSVKDRIALAMVEDAERSGKLERGMTIIEPTSGNTGIGLAMVAASKGYKIILTMPESMSIERRSILAWLGADIILTPKEQGMGGAVKKAEEMVLSDKNFFMPQQFKNPANPKVHRETTAKEIIEALGIENIDAFVAGVGTGGTITGVGEILKKHNMNVIVCAVEPKASPVLSGGKPAPHKIQGIGAGFVPEILDTKIYDEIIQVDDKDAYNMARELGKKEGLLVGISAGANVFASKTLAKKLGEDKNIVTILCDTGERYLSMVDKF
jgi:cysteine synthase